MVKKWAVCASALALLVLVPSNGNKTYPLQDYRLLSNVRPVNYTLKIITHFSDDNFRFYGQVLVDLDVQEDFRELRLHSKLLHVDPKGISLTPMKEIFEHDTPVPRTSTRAPDDGNNIPAVSETLHEPAGQAPRPAHAHYEHTKSEGTQEQDGISISNVSAEPMIDLLLISLAEPAKAGAYRLSIRYWGTLNEVDRGYYRASYQHNNETRWMSATVFEPSYARAAFPCFDEPHMKARFSLSIGRHQNYSSRANMPRSSVEPMAGNSGWFWDHYPPTPMMSTYLVAFMVFPSRSLESRLSNTSGPGRPVRVWTTPGRAQHSNYSLWLAPRVLSVLGDQLGVPAVLPKQDLVAVPGFRSEALENWGLISFEERHLLLPPGAAQLSRQAVGSVVAHELAHIWFGNLLTPRWWSDIWLSEGFATFYSAVVLDKIFPSWRIHDTTAGNAYLLVTAEDVSPFSPPLIQAANDPRRLSTVFNVISYFKGYWMLRMLNDTLGPRVFQDGIRRYVQQNLYGSVGTEDLWRALQEAVDSKGAGKDNLLHSDTVSSRPTVLSNEEETQFKTSQSMTPRTTTSPSTTIPPPTIPSTTISSMKILETKTSPTTSSPTTTSPTTTSPTSKISSTTIPSTTTSPTTIPPKTTSPTKIISTTSPTKTPSTTVSLPTIPSTSNSLTETSLTTISPETVPPTTTSPTTIPSTTTLPTRFSLNSTVPEPTTTTAPSRESPMNQTQQAIHMQVPLSSRSSGTLVFGPLVVTSQEGPPSALSLLHTARSVSQSEGVPSELESSRGSASGLSFPVESFAAERTAATRGSAKPSRPAGKPPTRLSQKPPSKKPLKQVVSATQKVSVRRLPKAVSEIMEGWVTQSGYPLIYVYRDDSGAVKLSQRKFSAHNDASAPCNTTWWVPIMWTSGVSSGGPRSRSIFWMPPTCKNVTLPTKVPRDTWIFLNSGLTGLYRVNYDSRSWQQLSRLSRSAWQDFPALSRMQLLSDALHMAQRSRLSYQQALQMANHLSGDSHPMPWKAALPHLLFVDRQLRGRSESVSFRAWLLDLVSPHASLVGFSSRTQDSPQQALFRRELTVLACRADHSVCAKKARKVLKQFMAGAGEPLGAGPLLPELYCSAVRWGSAADWRGLRAKLAVMEGPGRRAAIKGLACSKDAETLRSYLVETVAVNSTLRVADISSVLSAIAENEIGADLVLGFLEAQAPALHIRLDNNTSRIERIMLHVSASLNTGKQLEKLNGVLRHFGQLAKSSITPTWGQSLVHENIRWLERSRADLARWLRTRNGTALGV